MAVSSTSDADHAAHDALLLASLASGDALAPAERARADALLHECPECVLLLADLTAIRASTADLPAPRRRRDFRLTDADAARLRPSGWRGILAGFGSPRMRPAGPVGLGLATLGIAGLLFATVPAAPIAERSSTFGTAISGASQQVVTGWVPAGGAGAQSLAPIVERNAGDSAAASTAAPAAAAAPTAAPAAAAAPTAAPAELPPPAATAAPFGAGTERVASPEPSAGKASPVESTPAAEAAPASEPAMMPAPAAGATPGPGETAGEVGVAGGQAAPSEAGAAGEVAPPAADAAGGPGAPGTQWLLVGSLLVLAAGLALGGLRLAGRRAAGR